MLTAGGAVRPSLGARDKMLEFVNAFLQHVEQDTGMYVNLYKGSDRTSYDGLFKKNGLAGMLEAMEVHMVDNISPIIGTIVHSFGGQERDAPMADVLNYLLNIGPLVEEY